MKIMVSACLAGENCKYNGGNNRNEKVLQLMEENEVITVCPEQIGGLPTPRWSSYSACAVRNQIRCGHSEGWPDRGRGIPCRRLPIRL